VNIEYNKKPHLAVDSIEDKTESIDTMSIVLDD
jgi:hypothetical protein